ncbi:MAG TPA: metallophosphoesterase [Amycolatopsis sp.]|nr:metallophosphoesterase [Amycolatopsis sp.]
MSTRASLVCGVAAVIALLFGLLGADIPAAVGAPPVCTNSLAPPGFRVLLCLEVPAAGATLTGATVARAAVDVSGAAPQVNGVTYTLDGAYLLFDAQSPYTFTLHTYLFTPGPHTLSVSADFSGGFHSPPVSLPVTFASSTAPPPPHAFMPSTGTAPVPGMPLVVAAGGDGASGMTREQQVADLIAGWHPNLFLYLGDVYENGSPEELLNWYGENGSLFSRFRSITDPTIGNHEYTLSPTAQPYVDYWGGIPHYYSFDAGGWHFVSLDDTAEYGQGAVTSRQYQWLAADLARNTEPCTLVFFHRPVFSLDADSEATDYAAYWQLLNAHRVTLTLSGHAHNYQRWQPMDGRGKVDAGGVTEIVAGTAGQWLSPFVRADSRLAAGFDNTTTGPGALQLRLSGGAAAFSFQNVSGTVLDQGEVTCKGGAQP